MKFVISVLASIALLSACAQSTSKPAPAIDAEERNDSPLISLETCTTSGLRIQLNADGTSETRDLVSVLNLLTEYPEVRIHLKKSENPEAAELSAYFGDATRWTELQSRLLELRGIAIACELEPEASGEPPASDMPKQEEQQQDEQQKDGGVGVEN